MQPELDGTRKTEPKLDEKVIEAARLCTAEQEMFIYSGEITEENVNRFMSCLLRTKNRKHEIALVLTSDGGDPHAAYRFGRVLQRLFDRSRVIVTGRCKSAATLVAVACDEITFGFWGELGPLDIQVRKRDEIAFYSSGLDSTQALNLITGHVYTCFEHYRNELIDSSKGALSFRTACEIATSLATGFLSPITAQLDPYRLGEIDRLMAICTAYGERLSARKNNLHDDALDRLVNGYPSHFYIIDAEEAREIFKKVSLLKDNEGVLVAGINAAYGGCCREESRASMILDVRQLGAGTRQGNDDEESAREVEGQEKGDPRKPRKDSAATKRKKANGPSSGEAGSLPAS
jgi:hypothetical protein